MVNFPPSIFYSVVVYNTLHKREVSRVVKEQWLTVALVKYTNGAQ